MMRWEATSLYLEACTYDVGKHQKTHKFPVVKSLLDYDPILSSMWECYDGSSTPKPALGARLQPAQMDLVCFRLPVHTGCQPGSTPSKIYSACYSAGLELPRLGLNFASPTGCVIRDKILSTLWVSGASSENWGNKAPLGVYMRIKLNNTCRVLSIKYGTSQSTLKNISYCHYYNYSLENGQLSAQPHRLYIPWGHQQANMRALTGSFHFCVVRDSASHRPAGPGKRHHTWVSPSLWFGIIPHFMHSI